MKKNIMYATYRSEKAAFPGSIELRAKDAKHIVCEWRNHYRWGKTAYVKRIELRYLPEAIIEVREHYYKTINK